MQPVISLVKREISPTNIGFYDRTDVLNWLHWFFEHWDIGFLSDEGWLDWERRLSASCDCAGFFLMDSTSEYNMHDSIILKEMSLFSLFGQNHNLGFLRTAQGDLWVAQVWVEPPQSIRVLLLVLPGYISLQSQSLPKNSLQWSIQWRVANAKSPI